MARRLVPNASDEELLLIGPALHAVEGVAHIKPTRLSVDIARSLFEMEAIWDHSYEAELQIGKHKDKNKIPVCWMKLGYASGFASTLVGRTVLFREVECMGCGHPRCRVIGKTLEMWGGEAAEELSSLSSPIELLINSWHFRTGRTAAFARHGNSLRFPDRRQPGFPTHL